MDEQSSSLTNRVEQALEKVRPFLRTDGGDVELVSVNDQMVVSIRLLGSCQHCEISEMTMKMGIEEGVKHEVPEIKEVVAVNQHQNAEE
jgi:Fe-S cluster biogenesis protein NfuA